ncbi:EAL domain-containing protein [Populibacterium corticicola]|uniref:EAL domain-containing protein n=1 Tax=Populibacterium corticicola TaxID=1812826 RepID=A0ABW5XI23_9MICO
MAISEIRTDLSRLTAYFQPIVDLENWRVTGVEALARSAVGDSPWPLLMRARNEGWYEQLEVPLVEIAVREAAALPPQLWCTLNMSACTVFDNAVERLLSSHPERRWGIEVLERSGPIRDDLEFRERINELDCLMLIDDAGVGNNDEFRIHDLKPTIVKLDRLVLMSAHHHGWARDRVESLVYESRKAGALLLAEGVETAKELIFAQELGCELAQGYYFSAAVPAKNISATIAELEERLWFDAK